MVKIRILSVGKTRQKHLLQGEEDYLKRMSSFADVERVELGVEPPSSLSGQEARKREGEAILRRIRNEEFVIVLDEHGVELDSPGLASFLEDKMQHGHSRFSIIIGGAYGLDDPVKKKAALLLSLSRFTFPYQLTRFILIEQLYRAYTIIKGIPYQK